MVSFNPQRPPQINYGPVVIPNDRPAYRIKCATSGGGFFGPDDHLYKDGEMIRWNGEPNLEMEPLNELAQENMKKFLKKLDKFGREVAEKTGKSWTSLADAHENAYALAVQESKEVEVIGGKKQIPLMGAKKKSDIEAIEAPKETPLMGSSGKLSLGQRNEMVTVDG